MHPQSNQFEVFSCMVLSLRTGWDAHSGGVYIRNGHLVFKKSLPYQILALWHQLREAFYLSAYKMTSFITLLYLVIFWWLLFEIEKKKKKESKRETVHLPYSTAPHCCRLQNNL